VLKLTTKLDMLEKAVECLKSVPELREHVKLDLSDETERPKVEQTSVSSSIPTSL